MKIGIISTPNTKGQIVIPKSMRDKLGIGANVPLNIVMRGQSICLFPLSGVLPAAEGESSYPKLLARTKGSWAGEPWADIAAKRKRTELAASRKRKNAW